MLCPSVAYVCIYVYLPGDLLLLGSNPCTYTWHCATLFPIYVYMGFTTYTQYKTLIFGRPKGLFACQLSGNFIWDIICLC